MSKNRPKGRRAALLEAASHAFGWTRLPEGQLEAMEAVVLGRDVLAVMRLFTDECGVSTARRVLR